MAAFMKKIPSSFRWDIQLKEQLGVSKLPAIVGSVWFGKPVIVVNDSVCLNEFYVNKNAKLTKHSLGLSFWAYIMPSSILTMPTENPDYNEKRK